LACLTAEEQNTKMNLIVNVVVGLILANAMILLVCIYLLRMIFTLWG